MQMVLSDWLSYSRSSAKCDVFIVFPNFRCKRVIKFLRRLKEAHLRFLDLKKLENIEKAGTRVTNSKFCRDSLIRTTLRVKFNNEWEKHWKALFALISVRILLQQLDYSLSISMRR